jgi:hypothetical protein
MAMFESDAVLPDARARVVLDFGRWQALRSSALSGPDTAQVREIATRARHGAPERACTRHPAD